MIIRSVTPLLSRSPRSLFWLIALASGLLSSGCAKVDLRVPVFPVHGQVLFNGQPLAMRLWSSIRPRRERMTTSVPGPRLIRTAPFGYQLTTTRTRSGRRVPDHSAEVQSAD